MSGPDQATPDATRVFEVPRVYESWDSEYYDPIAAALYDRAVPDMLDLLRVGAGSRVLDAGCGPGVHSVRAAARGCRVHAIDVSALAVETTLENARRRGLASSVTAERADLTRLALPDASFDAVFSWGVLTHIPEIDRALDHLVRVLAPGGRLAIQINNCDAWDHALERLARLVLRRPNPGLTRLPFGEGCWYDFQGEKLWVWQADTRAIARHLASRGLVPVARRAVEATHVQQHLGAGALRRLFLRANNAWYRLGLPAGPAITNLLVFEKPRQ